MSCSLSCSPRFWSSVHFELPPSTIASPASSSSASWSIVDCVGSPAGTMSQTVRGASSLETRSSSEEAPPAPCSSAVLTASSEKSNATTSWSESLLMRWTMLPPILPSPTKPICMTVFLPLDGGGQSLRAPPYPGPDSDDPAEQPGAGGVELGPGGALDLLER